MKSTGWEAEEHSEAVLQRLKPDRLTQAAARLRACFSRTRAAQLLVLACIGMALSGMAGLIGCGRHTKATASEQNGDAKSYHMRGIIVATDAAKGEVQVNSEAIPGFMGAMVMPYKLKDPGIIQDLHAGDHLTATLLVSDSDVLLDQIVITGQAKPDYKPDANYHVPTTGDDVPDFSFTNQDAKQIDLRSFRGKTLLITFIYTRCPLADYCPRMTKNFAAIDKQLKADQGLYSKTHLLSISFDPAYDSSSVLRSYGRAYIDDFEEKDFRHWDFAAPSKAELPRVLQYFDVGATPEKNKTITHSLSTVLIGPDGKVAAWYPTNEWTVEEVMHDTKTASEGKPS